MFFVFFIAEMVPHSFLLSFFLINDFLKARLFVFLFACLVCIRLILLILFIECLVASNLETIFGFVLFVAAVKCCTGCCMLRYCGANTLHATYLLVVSEHYDWQAEMKRCSPGCLFYHDKQIMCKALEGRKYYRR